jgi:hypothetical protein
MNTHAELLMEAIEGNHQISIVDNTIRVWWNGSCYGLHFNSNNAQLYFNTVMMAYRIKRSLE